MPENMTESSNTRMIVRTLLTTAIVLSATVVTIFGFEPLLLWVFAGIPFLVAFALLFMDALDRAGYRANTLEWLFKDIVVIVWLMGLVLIVGLRIGLSVRLATLVAFMLLTAAGMALHYVNYSYSNKLVSATKYRLISITSLITILFAITLFWVSSPQLVIFDWPCRELEWTYKEIDEKLNKASESNIQNSDADVLADESWEALIQWEACRGGVTFDVSKLRSYVDSFRGIGQ